MVGKDSMMNVSDELMESYLEKEHESIARRAEEVAAIFWENRESMLEVRTKKALPVLGCRVVVKDSSVRMSWFYWQFYKKDGVTRRTNVHITKSKAGHSYSLKKLYSKALPNEYDAVEYCEQRFAGLRKEGEALRKLKHAFHYYKLAKNAPVLSTESESNSSVNKEEGLQDIESTISIKESGYDVE